MSSSQNFTIVVAATRNGGIGFNGALPWRLKGDMSFFKQLTTNTTTQNTTNAVIMGRKTWDSLPNKFRPLAGRLNVVLSRNPHFKSSSLPPTVQTYPSLSQALEHLADSTRQPQTISSIFVIGGSSIYKECLPLANRILLTRVLSPPNIECDTFVEEFAEKTSETAKPDDVERLQAGDEWLLQSNDHFDQVVLKEMRVEGVGKGGEIRVEGDLEYVFRLYERRVL